MNIVLTKHQTLIRVYDDSYHMPHFPKCRNSRLWLWTFQPKQIMICKNCNIVTNQSVLCLDIKAFPVYAPGRKQTLFLQCKNTKHTKRRSLSRQTYVYCLHIAYASVLNIHSRSWCVMDSVELLFKYFSFMRILHICCSHHCAVWFLTF